jgi:hypothetical protein
MSTTAMPWIKMHTTILDDPRLARLDPQTQATYFKLALLAGRCDAGGAFYQDGKQMTDEDIAWSLRMADTKELVKQFKSLTTVGLMINNGHGPELSNFMQYQGPTSHTMSREDWEKRQYKNRGDDTPRKEPNRNPKGKGKEPKRNRTNSRKVSAGVPRVRVREESEKRKSQSKLIDSIKRPTDNLSLTISKTFIVENIGIPESQRNQIVADEAIKNADLLAELSRNLARKGEGKGKVKNPSYITALNLLKHEYPAVDWYDLQKWSNHLPDAILENLGVPVPEKKLTSGDPDYRGLN